MRHLGILGLVIFGLVSVSGPAAAVTIGKTVRDAVVAREASGCVRSGCVQPIQMWSMKPRAAVMPADQRQLLERLLSRRLSDFINSGERQILSAALARGERLSGDAVAELVTMLREREGMLAQQMAATQRAQQEEEQRGQAEAEDRRQQEIARAEAAERERLRQEELARAQAAEQERLRQEALARADPAAAERSRQEQELARAEAAEQERRRAEALARAKAEEAALAVAQEALARAKAEEQARLQQEEELAQAKAQEEALARAAAAEAARSFVFYGDLPPLRPL